MLGSRARFGRHALPVASDMELDIADRVCSNSQAERPTIIVNVAAYTPRRRRRKSTRARRSARTPPGRKISRTPPSVVHSHGLRVRRSLHDAVSRRPPVPARLTAVASSRANAGYPHRARGLSRRHRPHVVVVRRNGNNFVHDAPVPSGTAPRRRRPAQRPTYRAISPTRPSRSPAPRRSAGRTASITSRTRARRRVRVRDGILERATARGFRCAPSASFR
jgi:hypothetical protein